MISTRYHMNSMLRLTALNLIGTFSLAVTLCVTFPFFLVIVSLGTVGAGADALGNHWNKGRRNARSDRASVERMYSIPAT